MKAPAQTLSGVQYLELQRRHIECPIAAKDLIGGTIKIASVTPHDAAREDERVRFQWRRLLEIEQVQALVKCPHCSYEGPPGYWDEALSLVSVPTLQCPECDGTVEVSQGHECAIQGVKFVR